MMHTLLPEPFYFQDALEVARALLGSLLGHGDVVLRITETEAYRWPDDSANHARHGRTVRNAALWGAAGRAYIYLCYGRHHLLNLVTGPDGEAAAVLIRACEPVRGLDLIRQRRHGITGSALLTGPAKVAAALGLDLSYNHHPVFQPGGLEVRHGEKSASCLAGPRVGVGYASLEDQHAPWRFALPDTVWVTHRSQLYPLNM